MPKSIYKDISERTGGNIYIGVVGPVRSGEIDLYQQVYERAGRTVNRRRIPQGKGS